MKELKAISYNNWKDGTYQDIAESLAPDSSFKLGLNLDSDYILGWLVSRLGTTIVGSQLVDAKPILGLHNFRDSVGSGSKLFAVISDGSYSDIYDVVAGTKSLENDTKNLDTFFLTYLDSCLRLNGTDQPKAWTGSAWVDTAGTFDLDNLPQTAKYAIEFKDRVYVAGMSANPDRVDISGIANSTTRAVSWTVGNRFILFEQEDGGGGITGLWKVPGYVIVGKKRTIKRYDGSSAYPEDMVNQGIPSQKAGVVAQGILFFVNENGMWATEGGDPKKISDLKVDRLIKSCSATNFANVSLGTDETHIYCSFASVTIGSETYTNIVLKYNILQNTFDIRKYPTLHRTYAKYVDSSGDVFLVFGDDDGQVMKLNVGNTDNNVPITWSLETQTLYFGFRLFLKSISQIGFITENILKASVMWRTSSNAEDWKQLGTIDNEEVMFDDKDLRGTKFEFKITDTTTTGREIIKSIELPEGTKVFESTK